MILRSDFSKLFLLLFLWSLVGLTVPSSHLAQAAPVDGVFEELTRLLPRGTEQLSADRAAQVDQMARSTEAAFAIEAGFEGLSKPLEFVQRVDQLHTIHTGVEAAVDTMLQQRGQFASMRPSPERLEKIRAYLQMTSRLIDLSARLRYTLYDATRDTAYEIEPQSAEMLALIDVLTRHKSSIGAAAIIDELFIPPKDATPAAKDAELSTKRKLLHLIAATKHVDLLESVAEFVKSPETPPELLVPAAATIHALGTPQSLRPGSVPGLPVPPILPGELANRLANVPARALPAALRSDRDRWVAYYRHLAQKGLTEEKYRLGECEVQPGDWLLMKNPSPYNRFTDLSPGLFTHVGVITSEQGSDGIRRMVLVDIPERGKTIHPVSLDTYVRRTLHYVVLRHPDPQVAAAMAEAARSVIGNPSLFDLNFRTSRIEELRGQPLEGKKIHTYCAGLLLLCAEQTTAPRSEFFPLEEFPAGGKTVANLAKMGLHFGADFVSPTGALFAPKLELVGKRPPMYSPERDIADTIYDHFAEQLELQDLHPAEDLYHSLRLKLAEAGKANPLLGKALTSALNVDETQDLVSAAKMAAVVETLDEVANGAGKRYGEAMDALRYIEEEDQPALTPEQLAGMAKYRELHADLYRRWTNNQISPRGLRIALVDYYKLWGRMEIDRRFFTVPE